MKVYEGTLEGKRGESSWTYKVKKRGRGESCWVEIRPHRMKNLKGEHDNIR